MSRKRKPVVYIITCDWCGFTIERESDEHPASHWTELSLSVDGHDQSVEEICPACLDHFNTLKKNIRQNQIASS
jgi:hypothetical protein